MNHPLSRRRFLRQALLLGGVVAATACQPTGLAMNTTPLFFSDRSRSLGLQLYTLGDGVGKDLDATFAMVAAIGYREVELPGLYGRAPAEIKAAAKRAGVTLSSLQLGANPKFSPDPVSLLSDASQIADTLDALGISQVVLPIPPFPPSFRPGPGMGDFMAALAQSYRNAGADIWKTTAQLLNDKAAALKPAGIRLGYHNHNLEFAPIGDRSGWEILASETDPELVAFELDTAWLAAAGLDPAAFLQRYSGRVRWLHLKDLKTSTATNHALAMHPVAVGQGKLDWPAILAAAHRAGVKHYYVEQEPPFEQTRVEAITASYRHLSQLRIAI